MTVPAPGRAGGTCLGSPYRLVACPPHFGVNVAQGRSGNAAPVSRRKAWHDKMLPIDPGPLKHGIDEAIWADRIGTEVKRVTAPKSGISLIEAEGTSQ